MLGKSLFGKDKDSFIKLVKFNLLMFYPESQSLFTRKIMNEAMIYISGYFKCLKEMGEEPMRDREINILLMEEAIEYIKNRLNL
jgi:hypothetical protein